MQQIQAVAVTLSATFNPSEVPHNSNNTNNDNGDDDDSNDGSNNNNSGFQLMMS